MEIDSVRLSSGEVVDGKLPEGMYWVVIGDDLVICELMGVSDTEYFTRLYQNPEDARNGVTFDDDYRVFKCDVEPSFSSGRA